MEDRDAGDGRGPPIRALLHRYASRSVSPVEIVTSLLERIDSLNPSLNAVVAVDGDAVLAEARDAERRWPRMPRPLEGVPFAVKDMIDTAALPTSYGSRMFAEHEPVRDAAVVQALRRAGALLLAKTATHEFAWGITTGSDRRRPTRNPWSPLHVPGGSSGGSAAAVAAEMVPLALGTDTAGSVRIPAAFCGVPGLRPTTGVVSTEGVFPLAPSLDVVGPIAASVDDLALAWSVLKPSEAPTRGAELSGLTVGTCAALQPPLPAAVEATLERVLHVLERAGARTRAVSIDGVDRAFNHLRRIQGVEALAVHRRLDLWPRCVERYGPDVRARLEEAESIGVEELRSARAGARLVRLGVEQAFTEVDLLLSAAAANGPVLVDAAEPADFRRLAISCTAPQSLAGTPALVLRAGFDADGLPIGVQLTAGRGRERFLLAVGTALERELSDVSEAREASLTRLGCGSVATLDYNRRVIDWVERHARS
jgi:aspartyl-tRNA(Asn)/glutamyl-tRNA(Gln) amidotransferase subunit A